MNLTIKHLGSLGLLGALGACATPPPAAAPAPEPVAAPVVAARQAPPPPMPLTPVQFPPFREFTLPNGMQVLVVEKRDQPVANVDLYVRSGSAADPANRAGLSQLMAALLTQGTPTRNAVQIAERIERVGGDINAFATDDYVRVSAGVLSDQLPLALDLVSDVSLRPTFAAAELETARKRQLSGLQASLAQSAVLADRQFLNRVYGPEHPYGRLRTAASIEGITRNELVAAHRNTFKPGNALLVVSGDVDADRVQALARQYFGGWTGGGVRPATFVEPPARGQSEVYFVHRPGSAQSNILVGHVGIRPDNPDYFPLQVLNKFLGAGADARLFLILREQKGWTYGAYSRLSRPKDIGYFSASAEVRNAVTDSALAELMTQLRRVRDEPVSVQELEAAKSFLIGSFPLRIETPGSIARQVADVKLLGVPVDYLTNYRERIAAVTAQDLQRVARQYVRPDQATVVVVGDATQVLDDVEKLGIGPVRLLDVTGQPLDRSALQVRSSTETFDLSRLRPMTLVYQFMVQGNPLGTYTSTLAQHGDTWTATTALQAGPMNQQREVRFGAGLTPIASKQNVSQGPVQIASDLQFASGRVTGTAKLPAQMGGDKTFNAEVVAGTIFEGMDEYALAVADLQPGKTITLPVFSVQSGSVVNQTLKVTGAETVTVPAGTFQTYRIETTAGQQPVVIYVRQDLPHIVVKQEFAGQPLSIVLQSIK